MPLRKVALGIRLTRGPFGGGNQFGHSLAHYLKSHGVTPTFNLQSADTDVILVTDTRSWLSSCAFDMRAALAYVRRHPHTRIILRVNECDQRKGMRRHYLNRLIRASASAADHVIFISAYLASLFPNLAGRCTVILNGADTKIFNRAQFNPWDGHPPLKLVTHHWSSHPYKGSDVYQAIDRLAATRPHELTFTYIGNLPPDVRLPHTQVISPLVGPALASLLKQHHAYITASRNEPAGMHHIEAASCGLPLLYRQSGALPEYCREFGIPFHHASDLPESLQQLRAQYHQLAARLRHYPHTSHRMCQQYLALFHHVQARPPAGRRTWRAALDIHLSSQRLRASQYLPQLVR